MREMGKGLTSAIVANDVSGARAIFGEGGLTVDETVGILTTSDETTAFRDTPLTGICGREEKDGFPMLELVVEYLEKNGRLSTLDTPNGVGETPLYVASRGRGRPGGSRNIEIERELFARRLADSLALDCAYIWIRIFQNDRELERFEGRNIYLYARKDELMPGTEKLFAKLGIAGANCLIRNILISTSEGSPGEYRNQFEADIAIDGASFSIDGLSAANSKLHMQIRLKGDDVELIRI